MARTGAGNPSSQYGGANVVGGGAVANNTSSPALNNSILNLNHH